MYNRLLGMEFLKVSSRVSELCDIFTKKIYSFPKIKLNHEEV
jgi:hypothetical protein